MYLKKLLTFTKNIKSPKYRKITSKVKCRKNTKEKNPLKKTCLEFPTKN